MADPWSILANARANTPDLGQVYMGAQRQRIADMMNVRRMEAEERKADREHAKEMARAKVGSLAASGDSQGARSAALEAGEFDLVKALDGMDDAARTTAGKRADAIGAAALFVQSQPEAARPALWDDAIRNLSSQGYTDLDQYLGQYSPHALSSIIASSGATKEYFSNRNSDRSFEAAQLRDAESRRRWETSEARAARNERRAATRFNERDLDRQALSGRYSGTGVGGRSFDDTSDLDEIYGR